VLRLPWQGHGPTRQAALAQVDTPYVIFSVDDALPRGRGFVRALLRELHQGWDAVVARQLPWPDSDGLSRLRLRRWCPPQPGPAAQADHVCTLYPTALLRSHPLPPLPIAEDAGWSVGRAVGRCPGAPLLHAHLRRPTELYTRNRDIHRQLHGLGRSPAVPDLAALVGALPSALREAARWGPRELPCQLAELLGQWRAAQGG
jgi:hypothetical protein